VVPGVSGTRILGIPARKRLSRFMGGTAKVATIPLQKLFSKFYAEGGEALAPCGRVPAPFHSG